VLLLHDTPDYPTFLFGAMRAGLVPVLLNTLTPPDLLQFYLADSGARAIVLPHQPKPFPTARRRNHCKP
jgi:acyl-CoA synthetase (AMP-forming)/AMP-acid ligase II